MAKVLVELEVEILARTEKAVLISDGLNGVWLPLSQVELEKSSSKKIATVTMTEWFET
jgi:hypothetical protein